MIITRSSKVHRTEITHWVRIITEVKKPNRNSKTNSCPADAALPHILLCAAPEPVQDIQLMEKAGLCSGCSTVFPSTAQHQGVAARGALPGQLGSGGLTLAF